MCLLRSFSLSVYAYNFAVRFLEKWYVNVHIHVQEIVNRFIMLRTYGFIIIHISFITIETKWDFQIFLSLQFHVEKPYRQYNLIRFLYYHTLQIISHNIIKQLLYSRHTWCNSWKKFLWDMIITVTELTFNNNVYSTFLPFDIQWTPAAATTTDASE